MATTTLNTNFLTNAPGYVYLLDAPTVNPGTDLVYANVVTGYYGKFFEDGLKKKAIKTGVSPWANLTSTGISCKISGDPLKFTNNFGQDAIPGLKSFKLEGEFSFADADAAHMVDALSVNSGSKITIAAAALQSGQTIVPLGSTLKLKAYSLCYVYESPEAPGEFNSILLPKVKISPDFDLSLSSDKMIELKVKFTAEMESWLRDPVTLKPILGLKHDATAVPA